MQEFNLIVAGGRDFADPELLSRVLFAMSDVELADKKINIVSGMAGGADALGYAFALKHDIMTYEFPALWDKYGKRAGFVRNEAMGRASDGLLAFYSGSRGTGHMIKYMLSLNKPVLVVPYDGYTYESNGSNKPSIWGANS